MRAVSQAFLPRDSPVKQHKGHRKVFGLRGDPCAIPGGFLVRYGIGGSYWEGWKVGFLSEALAFVTLTPAILSWFSEGSAFARKPRACHLEAFALIAGLILLSYLVFNGSGKSYSPALLYSLVPFLLWAALRFATVGVTSAVALISFMTIWGAIHARGPFADQTSLHGMSSLQLFLVSAALPFMFLAALGEERRIASRDLKESEERFRLAAQAGKMYAYDWEVATDAVTRSAEHVGILGFDEPTEHLTRQQFLAGSIQTIAQCSSIRSTRSVPGIRPHKKAIACFAPMVRSFGWKRVREPSSTRKESCCG